MPLVERLEPNVTEPELFMSSATSVAISLAQQTAWITRVIILLVAFINGFVIMSIELLGGRVLAPYFGSSVHVWGSIITVFMLSLSLGYLW
jgi:hypothetical protein